MSEVKNTTLPVSPGGLNPTAAQERIEVVDILRGFALLGILLVNMALFAAPPYQVAMDIAEPPAALDAAAAWVIRFLAESKFYSLFSILFGFGLWMQMTRARARGVNFLPLYVRRLLVLLFIGLAHAVFFWVGDILVSYALLGFPLLLFRNARPRTLLIWVIVFLSLVILLNVATTGLVALGSSIPEGKEAMEQAFAQARESYRQANQAAIRAYGSGSFGEIMTQRLNDLTFMYSVTIFILPNIFAMFLLGLYIGKRGILENVAAYLPLIRKALIIGLVVGVIGNLIYAVGSMYSERAEPTWLTAAAATGQTIGAPAFALAYGAAIILLFQVPVWAKRLAPLAPVGRMALTNYLLQTIICTTIFYSYGLGLYGEVGAAAGVALAFAIYLAQIPFSIWWLEHFRFGPVEWVWRTLTYGKRQPFRRTPRSGSLAPQSR